jgi:hypothetical protein
MGGRVDDATPDPTVEELGARAADAVRALARRTEPEAFQALLTLSQLVGECLGQSARSLAAASSWSEVAGYSGTTKQAAWSRWRTV